MDLAIENFLYRFSNYSSWFLYIYTCVLMSLLVERASFLLIFSPQSLFLVAPQSLPEKAMAPHSSTLAWQIPWMEEPGGLQSMRSLRVGHD